VQELSRYRIGIGFEFFCIPFLSLIQNHLHPMEITFADIDDIFSDLEFQSTDFANDFSLLPRG